MPDAKLIILADEVKAYLEAYVTTVGGTIERDYIPRLELKDTELGKKFLVVPRSETRVRIARGVWGRKPVVDIGVLKRVATKAETDALMFVAEGMADELEEFKPTESWAALLSVELSPSFDEAQLDTLKNFTSVVRVTFQAVRPKS